MLRFIIAQHYNTKTQDAPFNERVMQDTMRVEKQNGIVIAIKEGAAI